MSRSARIRTVGLLVLLAYQYLTDETLQNPIPDPDNPGQESNLFHYSDSHVLGAIDILGTVVASMTPLVSIIVLYFVKNPGSRLAILCAFTLAFSMSLALVTKARRIEIFAATAA